MTLPGVTTLAQAAEVKPSVPRVEPANVRFPVQPSTLHLTREAHISSRPEYSSAGAHVMAALGTQLAQALPPTQHRARVERPQRASLGGYAALTHETVALSGLEKLKQLLQTTTNAQGQDGLYQLRADLMQRSGWSAERLLRTPSLPAQVEGLPLAREALRGQADTHLVLVKKALHGENIPHAFPIKTDALIELQNFLWHDVRSSENYREGLRHLPD